MADPIVSAECKVDVDKHRATALAEEAATKEKLTMLAKVFSTSSANTTGFNRLRMDIDTGASPCTGDEVRTPAQFTAIANAKPQNTRG